MAVLRAVQGLNPGQIFPIEGDCSLLGRHPDCDIVLDSGAVSRQHARVTKVAGHYYVEDLHSRNGTFVNGRAVVGRHLLADNDELVICDLVFTFHQNPPDMTPAPERQLTIAAQPTAMLFDDARPSSSSTIMSKVDISAGSSGLLLEVNAEAKLKALTEINVHLGAALGLNEVLPKLLDSLFDIFIQADRGFIVLKDRGTDRLVPKAVKYRRNEEEQTGRISRTIVNGVMAGKQAILSADAASDSRFDMAESIVDFHIRSMMCAPLIDSNGTAMGVIQIDTIDQRNRFKRDDLEVLASVACLAGLAVENAQLHETALREQALARDLAVAHEVQRGFLPDMPPEIAGYDFFEFYDPAQQLGGDYYDYIPLSGGRTAVVVADVSGKGIAASLLMAKLSAETRYCLASESEPSAGITRLNRIFCGAGWEDRFVTMVVCVLDPAKHEVTIVNAGHMPPLLRHNGNDVKPLGEEITGLPLGVDDMIVYDQIVVPLTKGDSLTLYTDGITEAMDRREFLYGSQRLNAQLAQPAEQIRALGQTILDDVKRFVGKHSQSDDMCLVCFGREDG